MDNVPHQTKTLMPIGGNENWDDPVVLREFVNRAGGKKADIVIFTQPSILKTTGRDYARLFLDLGAGSAKSLNFRTRENADLKESIKAVRSASGIFISGGTQMRLPAVIGGTKLEAAVLNAYQRGVVIGGTSAGAAVMSNVMIANGKGGATPRERIAQFAPGLGLTDKIVFDQHFRQRDRLGRLLYVIAAHPGLLGVGIDENTAAIVDDEAKITVIGTGAVTVVDGSGITASNVAEVEHGGPVAVGNVRINVLTSGCSYNIKTRRAKIPMPELQSE
ncbi:MAG: cyanophycinase [Chloroflexi bacterium]|nr:cyanophycinase [Chloroflexota bacterium]